MGESKKGVFDISTEVFWSFLEHELVRFLSASTLYMDAARSELSLFRYFV